MISSNPSRSSLEKSRARLDVVCMCLERRRFQSWKEADFLLAINAYSDSSPVTGIELQGMVLDFLLRDGTWVRSTLPGSSLAYGLHDWASKALALVWAAFLICGPRADSMYYFLQRSGALPQTMEWNYPLDCFVTSYLPSLNGLLVLHFLQYLH